MDKKTTKTKTKIIPLNQHDSNILKQMLVVRVMFVFHQRLDSQKLRDGLHRLAERRGWEKIGARLQRCNGRLGYHIPEQFTTAQPAVSFSHELHDIDAKDHSVASQLPNASAKPSVVANSKTFHPLLCRKSAPKTVAEYVGADIPQVSLHVTSFRDITVVSLSWPHTFCDVMGMQGLLRAWTKVLKDPEANIPPPCAIEDDPLASLGTKPTEPYRLSEHVLSNLQLLKHLAGAMCRYLWNHRENRIVCVPAHFIATMRKDALARMRRDNATSSATFLSEGDILFAWWARLVNSYPSQNSDETINLITTACRREQLSGDLLPSDTLYLSNALGFLQTLVAREHLISEPIEFVASQIRQSILQDHTRGQIESYEAMVRNSPFQFPVCLGKLPTRTLLSTNWRKAKLYELDFGGALSDGECLQAHSVAYPSYIQGYIEDGIYQSVAPVCIFLGNDPAGNYWISGSLERRIWDHIDATLNH